MAWAALSNHNLIRVTIEKEAGDRRETKKEWRNSKLVAIGSWCYHYALCTMHCAAKVV